MVLTSSMSVYGAQQAPFSENMIPQPEDIYGISKAAMEAKTVVMSQVYGFRYVIFRPHNVYGPRQNLGDPYRNVIGIFINRLMQGKNFYIYGDGKQKRAFSYIDDVIPAMAKAAFSKSCEGGIINIGSDKAFTLKELADTILSEFFNGKMSGEFKLEYFPVRPQEVKYAYCSHNIAKKLLNFKTKTDLRTGIKKMITWAREIGPQPFTYLSSMDLDHKLFPKTWKSRLI